MKRSLGAAATALFLAACSVGGGTAAKSSPSSSALPSALAKASGKVGAQVPVPPGFPGDFPVYPGARLTAGASFTSSGQVSWGMEWQTLDSVAKVQAFYTDRLNRADWKMSVTATAAGSFAATFTRQSDSHTIGTLSSNGADGVTKILMSLVAGA